LYLEYPVFEDEKCDVSLINRFSDVLKEKIEEQAKNDTESKLSLYCILSENGQCIDAEFTLNKYSRGSVIKKKLLVEYEEGYIKTFHELL